MAEYIFDNCPLCGNEPELLSESIGDDTCYLIQCSNPQCALHAGKTCEGLQSCHIGWSRTAAANSGSSEDAGDDVGDDTGEYAGDAGDDTNGKGEQI